MTKEEFIDDFIINHRIDIFKLPPEQTYDTWGITSYLIPHPDGNISCRLSADGMFVRGWNFSFFIDNMELFNLNNKL